MTFDVAQLPGRARELKEAGIDAAYREMTRFGGDESGSLYGAAEQYMEGVEHIYDDFVDMPSPEDFASRVDWLTQAMAKLATEGHTSDPVTGAAAVSSHNPNLARIGSSGDLLDDWTGDAAQAYNENYADQFVPTASSQYAAVSVLRSAINAEAAVWQAARDDLDKLSSQAIDYMKDAGNKGGAEWAAVLSIAAAVITIPLTGGVSAAAIPAVAAGLSVAATGIGLAQEEGTPDSLGLDAGSSDKVIESLQKALGRLRDRLIEQEAKISSTLDQAAGVLDGDWDLFCLPIPGIAQAQQHGVNDPTMAGIDA